MAFASELNSPVSRTASRRRGTCRRWTPGLDSGTASRRHRLPPARETPPRPQAPTTVDGAQNAPTPTPLTAKHQRHLTDPAAADQVGQRLRRRPRERGRSAARRRSSVPRGDRWDRVAIPLPSSRRRPSASWSDARLNQSCMRRTPRTWSGRQARHRNTRRNSWQRRHFRYTVVPFAPTRVLMNFAKQSSAPNPFESHQRLASAAVGCAGPTTVTQKSGPLKVVQCPDHTRRAPPNRCRRAR